MQKVKTQIVKNKSVAEENVPLASALNIINTTTTRLIAGIIINCHFL